MLHLKGTKDPDIQDACFLHLRTEIRACDFHFVLCMIHWIILTSIQKSNYLSEKLMATSRATLPVEDSYHFL